MADFNDYFHVLSESFRQLLGAADPETETYLEVLALQARLEENALMAARHGDTEQLRHDRSRIIAELDKFSLSLNGRRFSKFHEIDLALVEPRMTTTAPKTWISVPSFNFSVDLQEGLGTDFGKADAMSNAIRGLIWATQAITLVAATAAFHDQVFEGHILWTFGFVAEGVVRFCVHSHSFTLLREMWMAFRLLRDSQAGLRSRVEAVKRDWLLGRTQVPFNVQAYPTMLMCNGLTRQLSLELPDFELSLPHPRSTSEFLLLIGRLCNQTFVLMPEIFDAPIPARKLLVYMHDHGNQINLGRVKINARNPDEFDFVNQEYDIEVGQKATTGE